MSAGGGGGSDNSDDNGSGYHVDGVGAAMAYACVGYVNCPDDIATAYESGDFGRARFKSTAIRFHRDLNSGRRIQSPEC